MAAASTPASCARAGTDTGDFRECVNERIESGALHVMSSASAGTEIELSVPGQRRLPQ